MDAGVFTFDSNFGSPLLNLCSLSQTDSSANAHAFLLRGTNDQTPPASFQFIKCGGKCLSKDWKARKKEPCQERGGGWGEKKHTHRQEAGALFSESAGTIHHNDSTPEINEGATAAIGINKRQTVFHFLPPDFNSEGSLEFLFLQRTGRVTSEV